MLVDLSAEEIDTIVDALAHYVSENYIDDNEDKLIDKLESAYR